MHSAGRPGRRSWSGAQLAGPLALLLVAAGPAWALDREFAATILAFDRFVTVASPVCDHQPARDCIEIGWEFADIDGDGSLSIAELELVRDALEEWSAQRRESLTARERSLISFGLWLVDQVGLQNLYASYDEDGDERLTREELLADVRLDERPLGEILIDPTAVDLKGLAERLGVLLPLLERTLR